MVRGKAASPVTSQQRTQRRLRLDWDCDGVVVLPALAVVVAVGLVG